MGSWRKCNNRTYWRWNESIINLYKIKKPVIFIMGFLFRGTIVRYYKLYFSFILKLYMLSESPNPTCAITKFPFPLFATNQHTNMETKGISLYVISTEGKNTESISKKAERKVNPANTMYCV